MIWSVYKYGSKSYDYYDDGKPSTTHAGAPPIAGALGDSIGIAPEAAAWRLPIGAKKIGSGTMPRGRIAALGGLSRIGMGDVDVGRIGVVAVAAYLIWRALQ